MALRMLIISCSLHVSGSEYFALAGYDTIVALVGSDIWLPLHGLVACALFSHQTDLVERIRKEDFELV